MTQVCTHPDTERAIRAFLTLIAPHYDIAGAILYGSHARGDYHADSDADLAILLNGPKGDRIAVAGAMGGVAFDNLLATDVLVSPLPLWVEEWEHPELHSNPYLLANIARDGVRL